MRRDLSRNLRWPLCHWKHVRVRRWQLRVRHGLDVVRRPGRRNRSRTGVRWVLPERVHELSAERPAALHVHRGRDTDADGHRNPGGLTERKRLAERERERVALAERKRVAVAKRERLAVT